MKNNLELQLRKLRNQIRLSRSEKDTHRNDILAFIGADYSQKKPIVSPFFVYISKVQYLMASILVLVLGVGGVGASSLKALPGDTLYAFKVKAVEPLRFMFTFNETERAALEIELVDKRLKEYAKISLNKRIDPVVIKSAGDSLNLQIAETQADITALQNTANVDKALENAGELQSTLAAHLEILKKIETANPEVGENMSSVIANTESNLALVKAMTNSVSSTTASTTNSVLLSDAIDEKQVEIKDDIEAIKQINTEATPTLDTEDKSTVNNTLGEINKIIQKGDEKDVEGKNGEALILYSEANREINKLQILLDADKAVGIDIIENAATSTIMEI